jgi:hypothetical protein
MTNRATTAYVTEFDLRPASLRSDFDQWYSQHIRKLLTVPGLCTAQRFEAVTSIESPLMAIYSLSDPGVIESNVYRAVGGPSSAMDWSRCFFNWKRNLFLATDNIADIGRLGHIGVFSGRPGLPVPVPGRNEILMISIGLDRTVPWRLLSQADIPSGLSEEWTVYKAISPLLT